MENYNALIDRMVSTSGLSKDNIERRIEARMAKLSGLISKEGAAQIIAAELGITFDNVQLKISELMSGMRKANFVGKVINLFPIREFERNGQPGKVANFIVADDTGSIKVVLWDTNHISLIEDGSIQLESVVDIGNATIRDGEAHLSSFSELKGSEVVFVEIKNSRSVQEKTLSDIQNGMSIKVRGLVVQVYNPRFFNVCSECGKKANQDSEGYVCAEHGKIIPRERALLNFVLDDGTDSVRVVLFSDQISKLISEENLKDSEKFEFFKKDLLGSEIWLTGNVRKNQLFNSIEVIGTDVDKVDVKELIIKLEN